MSKLRKIVMIVLTMIFAFSLSFVLASCNNDPPSNDDGGDTNPATVISIQVVGAASIYIDEFNYADYTIKVNYSDGTTSDVALSSSCLSSADRDKLTTAGTHTVTVNYQSKSTTFTITLADRVSNVRFDNVVTTYDGDEKTIQVTGLPAGATVVYDKSNKYTNAGVYTVNATVSVAGNSVITLSATLTINKATYDMSNVVFADKTVTYNGEPHSIIATNLPQGVTATYLDNGQIDAGTYTITAQFAGDSANYEPIANKTATLIINATSIDGISFANKTVTYNGQEHAIEITGTLPSDVTVTYSYNNQQNVNAFTNAGTYVVTAHFATTGNYTNLPDMTATLTINKAVYDMSNVVFADKTVTYNGEPHSIIATNLPQGVTVTYLDNGQINAGEYTITAQFAGDSDNYEAIENKIAMLKINKATYDMSGVVLNKSVKYDGMEHTFEVSNLPKDVIAEFDKNCTFVNAGVYTTEVSFTSSNSNYKQIVNMLATLTINKATYDMSNVVFEDKTVTYNGESHSITATNLPQGVTATYINNNQTNVGEYVVTAQFAGDDTNYELIADMTATLVINPIGIRDLFEFEEIDQEIIITKYIGKYSDVVVPATIEGKPVVMVTIDTFINNTNITSVTFDGGFTDFTEKMFAGCINLQQITISSAYAGQLYTLFGDSIDDVPTSLTMVVYATNSKTIDTTMWQSKVANHSVSLTWASDVTSIPSDQFFACVGLTNIIVPNGVTSIGNDAFYSCINLQTITLPHTLKTIGYETFKASGLTSVIIPASVTDINTAFSGATSLTSVTFTEGINIRSIDGNAFYGCTNLISINIPSSVTSIGSGAFQNCSKLSEVYVSDLTKWCQISFSSSDFTNPFSLGAYLYVDGQKVTDLVVPDGVTNISSYAFEGFSTISSVTIPNSVTSIGFSAFSDCVNLESVIFEENSQLTSIKGYAFSGCNSLLNIVIPASVKSIGSSAFENCSVLTNVTFEENSKLTTIESYAFYKCSVLESIVIPKGVTSIGSNAFYYCNNIESVYIEDLLAWCNITYGNNDARPTKCGVDLYLNGSKITELVLPNRIKEINDYAFYGVTSITSVTIPFGCANIGTSAFYGCSRLISVTIPSSIISIGEDVFYNCKNIKSVYIEDISAWCNITFEDQEAQPTRFGADLYLAGKQLTEISIPDGVTTINSYAFSGCINLTRVVIPDSVTSVGANAFSGCSGLMICCEVATQPSNWDSSWNGNCPVLWGVSQLVLDNQGFEYAIVNNEAILINYYGNDAAIEIPSTISGYSVTAIGNNAFYNKNNFTSIVIPSSVTSIGSSAFYGCSGIESITLPFVGEKADGTGATHLGYIFGASSYDENATYVPTSLKTVVVMGGSDISSYAFYNCSNLISIEIPNSVTSIGSYAFYNCSSLTSIVIPSSVTSIGSYAFRYCSSLTSVEIPDSVTSIGLSAFRSCNNLESITLPFVGEKADGTGATHFGYIFGASSYNENATYVPTSLKTVVIIGGSVISSYAFRGCNTLTSITIPSSVTIIGSYAFYNCDGLTGIVIPTTVTSVGESAFSNCDGLTSVEIPSSVTSIGSYAFSNCSNLENVTFGDNSQLISIGSSAFKNCSSLNSITLPFVGATLDGTENTHFGYIFGASSYDKNSTSVPTSLKTVVITGGLSIGSYAFSFCKGLRSVTIPASVTSLGSSVFNGCDMIIYCQEASRPTSWGATWNYGNANSIIYWGVESVITDNQGVQYLPVDDNIAVTSYVGNGGAIEIPSTMQGKPVTTISEKAFYNASITNVLIPNSVTSIGSYAFYNCSSLTSIVIPSSVTSIDSYAFSNCSSLTSVTFGDNSQLTSIGSYAFNNCSSLTSIEIPSSVTNVGNSAFSGCDSLQYNVSNNVKYISNEKDQYIIAIGVVDSTVSKISIADSCIAICGSVFSNCSSLTSIEIPSSVTSIGSYAFSDCSNLKNVTFGDNSQLISIGSYAFYYCSSLTSIEIPSGVTSIGSNAFYFCSRLTSIEIPSSVTSIGSSAFYGCSRLRSIEIPSGVTSIGYGTFYGCSSLTSIEIPSSVTSIGDEAFTLCGLTSIEIPASVTSIGVQAFDGSGFLTSIVIPSSVTSISEYAFYRCSSLTIYCEATNKPSGWDSDWNYSNCPVYWYSETQPTTEGNYWHYVDGVVTVW